MTMQHACHCQPDKANGNSSSRENFGDTELSKRFGKQIRNARVSHNLYFARLPLPNHRSQQSDGSGQHKRDSRLAMR